MKYYEHYKTIKRFVNKSGVPRWIRQVLLRDEEFLNDADEWCSLHYLSPKKFPLKEGLKELIKTYSRQAILTQFFVENVPYNIKRKIKKKIEA